MVPTRSPTLQALTCIYNPPPRVSPSPTKTQVFNTTAGRTIYNQYENKNSFLYTRQSKTCRLGDLAREAWIPTCRRGFGRRTSKRPLPKNGANLIQARRHREEGTHCEPSEAQFERENKAASPKKKVDESEAQQQSKTKLSLCLFTVVLFVQALVDQMKGSERQLRPKGTLARRTHRCKDPM